MTLEGYDGLKIASTGQNFLVVTIYKTTAFNQQCEKTEENIEQTVGH